MPALHGRSTGVVVQEHDLSKFFKSISIDGDAELLETTTFTAPARQYIIGYTDGKVNAEGIFGSKDPAVSADPQEVDDVLQPALGNEASEQLVVVAQEGLSAFGKSVSFLRSKPIKYSVVSPVSGVISVMSEMQADGGVQVGALLAEKVARTVTGNSAAFDLGAASTNGFVAQLHAFAVGTTTSVIVTLEDSTDGATGWAQFGAFTARTSPGAQRIEVGGVVRRYVRAKWTFTGTNGATLITVFALQR